MPPSTAMSNVLPSKSIAFVSNTLCKQICDTTPGSYTNTTVSFPSVALANNQPVYDE